MLNDAFLSRLDALRLAVKRPAAGGAGGARRSVRLGSSAEFSDFRNYVPGDDIRRLDWNAYARFDKLFMKLFMEEQESIVTVLVDASASMQAKREEALQAAEAVCYLALGGNDRVRIAWLGEKQTVLSPFFAGRRAYPQASGFLNDHAMEGATRLVQGIRSIAPYPRGISFLITDAYQEDGVEKSLDLLAYLRQEAALVQVLSPFEMKPELSGAVRLQDAEGAPDMDIVADEAVLKAYQTALRTFLNGVREHCHKRGVPYVLLCGDKPFEQSFLPALARSGALTS